MRISYWRGFRNSLIIPAVLAGWSSTPLFAQSTQSTPPPSVHVPGGSASELPPPPAIYRMGDQVNIPRAAEPGLGFAPRRDLPTSTLVVAPGDNGIRQASYEAQDDGKPSGRASNLMNGDQPLLPPGTALLAARNQLQSTTSGTKQEPIVAGTKIGNEPLKQQPLVSGRSPSAMPPTAKQSGDQQSAPQVAPQVASQPIVAPLTKSGPQFVQSPTASAMVPGSTSSSGPQQAANTAATSNPQLRGMYTAGGGTQDPLRNTGSTSGTNVLPGTAVNTVPADFSQTPSLKLAIPSVEIQAFGPTTIGIHKPVQFRVVCANRDSFAASRVSLTVNLPQWVRVQNVSTSTGRRFNVEEQNSGRVNWVIENIPAGQSHTMVLDVVATKAELFDFGIDWAMQPVTGSSRVGVTEPRLEMSISGPNEVLYGETAHYDVTVRNPGTGMAEAVVVMLPEALGGEKSSIGDIGPGEEKTFHVELLARAAGQLDLTTSAAATGNLQASSTRNILVRRPHLDVAISGATMKYAGATADYEITVRNDGDAIGREIVTGIVLPPGVQYLGGIEGAELVENGLKWTVGTLDVGDIRRYKMTCQMNVEGTVGLEVAARGSGEIASVASCKTTVETIADMVLLVEDPKGPLPLNEKLDYTIRIRNRGTRAAEQLNLVFMFSEGIEPSSASGLANTLEPGKVTFAPIPVIEPGQEMTLVVTAQANKAGTHKFRAQLTGTETDSHEVAEGTTRFYGEQGIGQTRSAEGSTGLNSIR